jgi:hypothetical protein
MQAGALEAEGFRTWTNNPAIALCRSLFAARFCLPTLWSKSSDMVACSAPRCSCCAMVRESAAILRMTLCDGLRVVSWMSERSISEYGIS